MPLHCKHFTESKVPVEGENASDGSRVSLDLHHAVTRGHLKRSARAVRAVQLFGRLAVLQAHTL